MDSLYSLKKILTLLFIISLFMNCSENADQQSDFEKQFAARLKARCVDISHKDVTTTTNGILDSHENYLSVEIVNSKEFEEIKHNETVLNNVCKDLATYLTDSVDFGPETSFDQIKFEFIESRKLLLFTQKESTVITKDVKAE